MNRNLLEPEEYLNSAWCYQPDPGFHDEVLNSDGKVRDHWQGLVKGLLSMGPANLSARWQEGRRMIHDNGVTYNVYEDPQSTDRPWPLDPLPLILSSQEWECIETSIRQRATLLNAILADLYGQQRLLRDDLMPAELVFSNPAFLRPCWGVEVPGGQYLHVYSADLARSPDGRWWVIADRTQAPSGAGYALENRLVSSSVLPDVFRSAHIQRLAGFFQTYRETLQTLAPRQRDNPRIVLLTPGPYNETYFEHAFLARYLGYTLVEGGDLTVRESRVYLKTLGGLLPVDVIVRRQDDSFCDPLELRSDSMLGVPGLMQAVRAGNVAIANALGTGVVESAAPSAFLPGLCKQMLGEELKMPSIATWWCGQRRPFAYVKDNIQNLVIKSAFPSADTPPVFGSRLSESEKTALLDRISVNPGNYVAQEQVRLSTVPVWNEGRLSPRHMVLRVYAVASKNGYAVMPGGLTRVSASLDNFVVSMQRGGGSKDTWVLGDGPPPQFSLLKPATQPLEVSRATFDLPSRVADNLFWLGRYVERVEMVVRTARATLTRLSQESDLGQSAGLDAGIRILAAEGVWPIELADGAQPRPALERELLKPIYDSSIRGGLAWSIHQVRRVAWYLRDRISVDAWRILNRLDEEFSNPAPPDPLRWSGALDLLNHAIMTLSAFSGLVMENTTRGEGWRFLQIGRRIERGIQMAEILRHGLSHESGALEAILEIADSSLTYRSRYLTSMQPGLVLDLLLVDEANPRSIAFQLARLREYVDELPESQSLTRRPAEAKLILGLLTTVQLADVRELVRLDESGEDLVMDTLLTRVSAELKKLSETLTRVYFNRAAPSRRFLAS